MSKNRKVIFASVGILLALIMAVVMIRDPAVKVAPAPQEYETPVPTKSPASASEKPKELDDNQKKVAEIIDSASDAVVREAPGIWSRIVDSWNWVMAFDAKHAIILIVVVLFAVGIIVNHNGGNKNKRKQN